MSDDWFEESEREKARLREKLAKGGKKDGFYDPVSTLIFFHGKQSHAVSHLYRHWFGLYPAKTMVDLLIRAWDDYGIEALSDAMSRWRDSLYNPRNIVGMLNMLKREQGEREPVKVRVLPQIFHEEENEHAQNGTGADPRTA